MNIYLKNILKYIYIRPTLGAFNEYLYNRPTLWAFNIFVFIFFIYKYVKYYKSLLFKI